MGSARSPSRARASIASPACPSAGSHADPAAPGRSSPSFQRPGSGRTGHAASAKSSPEFRIFTGSGMLGCSSVRPANCPEPQSPRVQRRRAVAAGDEGHGDLVRRLAGEKSLDRKQQPRRLRGVEMFSHQPRCRRARSTPQTSVLTAAGPPADKRRVRKKWLATASAGRGSASITARRSMAAASCPAGVMFHKFQKK